ncbi:hypothetical protein FRB96_002800 [Tulasnella sp. 330]|nr:hypothetical protein FRB96_002800 [Tulasnella sp. 330]KAG8877962.1 hypothetical protein FRB97_002887 [Tulasnella sp. 331]KAG8883228.1 hypothetical protein FRB98_003205 [Tulasnella sp. 332]
MGRFSDDIEPGQPQRQHPTTLLLPELFLTAADDTSLPLPLSARPGIRPKYPSPPGSPLYLNTQKPFVGRTIVRYITLTVFLFILFILRPILVDHLSSVILAENQPVIVPPAPEVSQLPPLPPPPSPEQLLWDGRADEVKAAFKYAYWDYERFAFPHDELDPLTNSSKDNFNGWGVSALDSLDTMVIMGLEDEFRRALVLLQDLNFFKHDQSVPFFETVIRYLGGLLSAWHLTKEPILLFQADRLGTALLPAFNTSSGFPSYSVNPAAELAGKGWRGGGIFGLAESASCQMEYKYLAKLTGRQEYFEVAERIMDGFVLLQDPGTHMWTQSVYSAAEAPYIKPGQASFSVGAAGDSAYEYLLKQYLLSNRTETKVLDLYLSSVRGAVDNLLYVSPTRNLLYVTDVTTYNDTLSDTPHTVVTPSHVLEHLACFFSGLLALGAYALEDLGEKYPAWERQIHMDIARGLATTCYLSYADMASGLGADSVRFDRYETRRWRDVYDEWYTAGAEGTAPGFDVNIPPVYQPEKRDYFASRSDWLSRPETVESLFILYRITGEPIWRERGYEIFQAIEKWSKGPVGYASVGNVDRIQNDPHRLNEMPSYFLAETLKYLYLLFRDDDSGISLDEIVFNTEAHPLPIFEWNNAEKHVYGIGRRPETMVSLTTVDPAEGEVEPV